MKNDQDREREREGERGRKRITHINKLQRVRLVSRRLQVRSLTAYGPKSLKLVVVAFPLDAQNYGISTTTGPAVSG